MLFLSVAPSLYLYTTETPLSKLLPTDYWGLGGEGWWLSVFGHKSSSNHLASKIKRTFLSTNLQFSSVTRPTESLSQSCPTLRELLDCSTPGLPVHHQLPEFTQTHVHWVGDAIQPSHPLSSPSPPAFNLSQHQGLFK